MLLNKFSRQLENGKNSGGKKARDKPETCKYFSSAKMPKCSLAQATRDESSVEPNTMQYEKPI